MKWKCDKGVAKLLQSYPFCSDPNQNLQLVLSPYLEFCYIWFLPTSKKKHFLHWRNTFKIHIISHSFGWNTLWNFYHISIKFPIRVLPTPFSLALLKKWLNFGEKSSHKASNCLRVGVLKLEQKTCDILAAERLRLMRFDYRLIIDSFQKNICILKW